MNWRLRLEKEMGPFLDDKALIGKIDYKGQLDYGDSVHNCMTRIICLLILEGRQDHVISEYEYYCSQFQLIPGVWIRNPNKDSWVSDPDKTSRDAMTPIACALALFSDIIRANWLTERHRERWYLFAQGSGQQHEEKVKGKINKRRDPTLFEFNGLLKRGRGERGLLLYLADFEMLLGVVWREYFNYDNDIRNYALTLMASKLKGRTFIGDIARWLVDKDWLIKKIDRWWGQRAGEPPIHIHFKDAVERIL